MVITFTESFVFFQETAVFLHRDLIEICLRNARYNFICPHEDLQKQYKSKKCSCSPREDAHSLFREI